MTGFGGVCKTNKGIAELFHIRNRECFDAFQHSIDQDLHGWGVVDLDFVPY